MQYLIGPALSFVTCILNQTLSKLHYPMYRQISTGRPTLLSADETNVLVYTCNLHRDMRLRMILDEYEMFMYGPRPLNANHNRVLPSVSTIDRILHLVNITVKVLSERRHILFNPCDATDYLRRVQHHNPNNYVNIDGTVHDRKSFFGIRCRTISGTPCILPQFRIGKQTFRVLAAVCPYGF